MIVTGDKITSLIVSASNGDTYGDAMRALFRGVQSLVMPNTISMTLSAPPISPSFGDTYVVNASSPSGAWAAHGNDIAAWAIDPQDGTVTTGAWEFYAPLAGWRIYDNNTGAFWTWNGSWVLDKAAPKLVVTAASTTTLSPASNSSFRINLGAFTPVVLAISAGAYDGQEITVEFVQSTGTTVVNFASNIHGVGFLTSGGNTWAAAPSTGLNTVSVQRYAWDLTNAIWYATALGVSGQ